MTNKCNLENGTELFLPFKGFNFPDATEDFRYSEYSDSSNTSDEPVYSGKTSSGSISIGVIIGILGGVLVIIAIVIIKIFCF